MRALTGGSIVLAFAIVLLSWDASRRFAHVRLPTGLVAFEAGSSAAHAPTAAERAAAAPVHEEIASKSRAVIGATAAQATEAVKRTTDPDKDSPRALPRTPRPLRDTPALAVRQVTPGSKAHAEAIASTIESDEYRNTVEPLARLYFAFFDRTADYEGLNYYIGERDGDVSLASIADEFAGSTEFRLRYGTLDNAAFIDRLFANVFGVAPDAAQRDYWIGQLDAGMSRGRAMLAFSESGAFRAATSNEVFVTMAYAEALGREPDPAGFARWVSFLDAGNPRAAVIAGLIARR